MSPLVKRYRDIGIVAALLVVPFFVLRANMKRPENLNALDRAILRVSAPIEYGASSVGRGLTNLDRRGPRCERRSASTDRSDPIGDALHHRALDPEIAVRRHPLARVGASGDRAAGHHYQLLARGKCQGGEYIRRIAGRTDRTSVALVADDEHRDRNRARLGIKRRLAGAARAGDGRGEDDTGYFRAEMCRTIDRRCRALAGADEPNRQIGV